MNSINISGRLTATPELKTTGSGLSICRFTIAVRRPMSKETTDFIPCVAWRDRAAFVAKNFLKGQRIEITGALATRQYEDKDGKKRTAYEVQCDHADFGSDKLPAETVEEELA